MSEYINAEQILKMAPTPLALNENIRCPTCSSRNVFLYVNRKSADVMHFVNGVLDFKQHDAVSVFSSISMECKQCGTKFENSSVTNINQIFI